MKQIPVKTIIIITIVSIYAFLPKTTIIASEAYNPNTELFAIHPKVGLLLNYYFSDFRRFQGVEDCGLFESGFGQQYGWGLFMEKKLSEDYFMGVGLVFNNRSGSFLNNNAFPSRNSNTGNVENVRTENMIDITLRYLELQPELRYTITDDFIAGPVRLMIAARAFNTYSDQKFSQYEKIASPENAVFIRADGLRTQSRDIGSGSIRTINRSGLGVSAGIENLLHAGNNIMISQQLAFDYNFRDVTTDASWTILTVRLDIGVRFGVTSKKPEVPEPEIQPLPKSIPQKEKIDIAITPPIIEHKEEAEAATPPILSLNIRQGDDMEILTGNELLATIPLVNAVFFAKNSDDLPKDYLLISANNNYFTGGPVARHYEILPRIAAIVGKNPGAKITLIGTKSGAEMTKIDGRSLAESRAKAVRDAFINLGIPKSIIKIKSLPAPRHRSNEEFELGIIENQRVDIEVAKAYLQEYVDVQKFSELKGSIIAEAGFENIPVGHRVIYSDDLSGLTIDYEKPGYDTLEVSKRLRNVKGKLNYSARLQSGDVVATDNGFIDLNELNRSVIDLDLSKFEAILRFDYNSSNLSNDNKGLLEQLSAILPAGATITISGSTDALGTDERNVVLKRERAAVTQAFIQSVSGDKFEFEAAGNDKKFDEQTPQGRFLNRSIRIRVRK